MPTVFFETFGCQMNVADSDLLAGALACRGFDKTENSATADLIVVNTCSVREHAETRARAHIAQHAAHKRQEKRKQEIWVIGCMAERLGDELKKNIPGIDRVIGARSFETFLCELDRHIDTSESGALGAAQKNPVSRFVPIMRGCDNYCTYCVVPYVRGPEISLSALSITDSIKAFIDKGAKEITLLGQNVNSYRDGSTDFVALLHNIHNIPGLERIRFTTSHPKDFSEALIKTVAELPKLCKHIHLPVQSGSDRILALMNRKYTRSNYLAQIDMIRKHIDNIDITTDAMVGFSSETDDDFAQTLSLFLDVKFTTAFMFIYSKRSNTAAASMPDDVPLAKKKQRLKTLIECQTRITKESYKSMIGSTVNVLFTDRQDHGEQLWIGQDYGCKRVLAACSTPLAGTILPVTITKSSGMTLVAQGV